MYAGDALHRNWKWTGRAEYMCNRPAGRAENLNFENGSSWKFTDQARRGQLFQFVQTWCDSSVIISIKYYKNNEVILSFKIHNQQLDQIAFIELRGLSLTLMFEYKLSVH